MLTNYGHANLLKIISNKDLFNLLINLPQQTDKHKPRRERKKKRDSFVTHEILHTPCCFRKLTHQTT